MQTLDPSFFESGRSRARTALDSLGEALLTIDAQGRIDYANPAAQLLLASDSRELTGRTLDQVVTLVDETDRKMLRIPWIWRCAAPPPLASAAGHSCWRAMRAASARSS